MVKPVHIRPTPEELYLDCNATTPVLPEIVQAVAHVMESVFGNPSSSHITGLKARYILDNTRRLARQVIGASSGHLIFTSGATEGIQTAVLSALRHAQKQQSNASGVLLYGATEHKAVPQALAHWNDVLGLNAELLAIPVDGKGQLDLEFLAKHAGHAHIICTMVANNETGVWQDLKAIEEVIRSRNKTVPWLVDCVQALGKRPLDLDNLTIDYAPFSGHKLYAPKGIGFLYVRASAPFTPLIIGGGQEAGLRSGTENLPGIAALHALFELLLDTEQQVFRSTQQLSAFRDQLATALKDVFPAIEFNHDFALSVPTTLNFSVRGVPSRDIMDVFDAANIRVSSGSACSSKVTRSYVLDAMGLANWRSESAVRMSFGPAATAETISEACLRIRDAAAALRQSCMLISDTKEDVDGDLDGVVQLKYDDKCCYLIIDRAAGELAVIDPLPQLAERIENLVRCQDYRVVGVLSTTPQSANGASESTATMLAKMLCASGCDAERDACGWPATAGTCDVAPADCQLPAMGCLAIGERRLFRVGTRLPAYLLSSPLPDHSDPRVDFAFMAELPEAEQLVKMVHDDTLICLHSDHQHHLTLRRCEATGGCGFHDDIDIGLDDERELLQDPETIVIDVRERQEHQMKTLPVAAQVLNVPVTRTIQFIYEQRELLADRTLVCICRSGNRSATVAQALLRHGFKNVRHLTGGMAFL